MKEEIYTIPVMDGFKEDCECPFCAMKRTLENNTINYVLSPSYMEEDVRGETNEKGFCKIHLKQLYDKVNALGLALMMHSHLKHRIDGLNQVLAQADSGKVQKGLFAKKVPEGSNPLADTRKKWNDSCYICDRIQQSFSRYLSTFSTCGKSRLIFAKPWKNPRVTVWIIS